MEIVLVLILYWVHFIDPEAYGRFQGAAGPAGELRTTEHSDGTPTTMLERDRVGRIAGLSDVSGTGTFNYGASDLQLDRKALTGGFLSKTLQRGYDTLGRSTGLTFGNHSRR